MSTNTLITRTSGRGLEPNHSRLLDRHGQMVAVVRQRLGPEHAALFAEPTRMGAGSGSDIAWYAEGDVEPKPLLSLPEDVAARVRQRLERLKADIVSLAETLGKQGEASQDLASLLRAAVVAAGDSAVWVAGEQPILVDWGRRAAVADDVVAPAAGAIIAAREQADPVRAAPAAPSGGGRAPPSGPAASAGAGGSPGAAGARNMAGLALWLLFAVLLAMLAGRLLQACGVGGPGWPASLRNLFPQYCTAGGKVDPVTNDAIASLEAQARAAELALARKIAACEVSCPAPPQRAAAPPSLLPIQEEITRRLPSTVERGKHLEITLTWEGSSDLDLYVSCPGGAIINYRNHEACGGKLVADLNRDGGTPQSRAVEHIIWADGPPAPGAYRVGVAMFNRYGDARASIPYHVAIWRNGRVVREERREISANDVIEPVLTLTSPLE